MMLYVPNLLTLARIGMVPWLVVLLQQQNYLLSLVVFVIAGISDAVDGYIAKKYDAITKLGSILDPIADKALLVSAYVMLSIMEIVPFWLVVTVVFRDLVIVGGYLIMEIFFGEVTMKPLRISKVNTVVQITFVVIVLVTLAWQVDLSTMLTLFGYLVFVTSAVSGAAYVYIWSIKTTQGALE
ncbi:MAG: CDP-alcohol phosphatidyltransferase family protein [Acidiferrobacterales bacterium]|nr:CDP-alcohol phosphatidyltransferase family protein [Acidiferrobacterales bacterium]